MRHVPTRRPRAARLLALVVLLLVPVSVGVGVPGVPGVPGPVPAEASTSVTPMIATGGAHTCELVADGTVRCWGDNSSGQLGDGTTTDRPHRVTVRLSNGDPLTGVTAITVGGAHTCALLDGGTVRCWGNNFSGQLGNGTSGGGAGSTHPVTVLETGTAGSADEAPLAGVTAVSAGISHTCAIVAGGAVRCWGQNASFQVGAGVSPLNAQGVPTPTPNPVPVLFLFEGAPAQLTGVSAITAGAQHTCVRRSGSVWCWGDNLHGQLGNGTHGPRNSSEFPVRVMIDPSDGGGPLTDSVAVSAGETHTCALTESDHSPARCWGQYDVGQLGIGTSGPTSTFNSYPRTVLASGTPSSVRVALTGVTAIAANGKHTCAVLTTGDVRCWGGNNFGQLGDGTTDQRMNPVPVLSSGTADASPVALTGVAGISTGVQHTCALLTTGGVRCWGRNQSGQLGDGTFTTRLNPVAVLDSLPPVDPPVVDPPAPAPAPAPAPSGPSVSCAPDALTVGTEVTCTVTGGDPGIDILWHAAVNPVIASDGVTLDADGRGTFGFTVPASAAGSVVTVELVGWTAPVAIGGGAVVGGAGGVGGPVPTSVPAGEGGVVPGGLYALLGVVALVGATGTVVLGRRTPAEH